MISFEKTFDWKITFTFHTNGAQAMGQVHVIAQSWEEVIALAKDAPFVALAEATDDEDMGVMMVESGSRSDQLEIVGIEKLTATLVPIPETDT